ncbi:MAG: hypothetical protein ACSHW0_04295 [Thalassotalea sp.]
MLTSKSGLIATAIILLTGCSSQALYEAAQYNRANNCQLKPIEIQEACEQELNQQTYDEYQKSKKALAKQASNKQ